MEIEFREDEIIFDRELSLLDSFVLSFTKHLASNNIKYVIVSGYVAILFGRSRISEDVDILIEHCRYHTNYSWDQKKILKMPASCSSSLKIIWIM